MTPDCVDASIQLNQPLAEDRIFGERAAAALDRFRKREQAIEALFAAAGGAEHVALMKERGVGDDPSFVELGDQVSTRHANVVEENFVEAAIAGHLHERTNGDSRRMHVD